MSRPSRRDPFLDSLRGIFHVALMMDHLPFVLPGIFPLIAGFYEGLGYVSVAEGFVFLSGFVSGLVYTRISQESGNRAMWRKALLRARDIYICYLIAVILMLAIVKDFGMSGMTWMAWNTLLRESLAIGSIKVASLLYQPTFLEILPMYTLFLLLTPILISQLEKGRYIPIILLSVAIWYNERQFNIREKLLIHHVIQISQLNLGYSYFGYFNSLAWQILFVSGLICGHKTLTSNGTWLPDGWKFPLTASVIVITLCSLHHGFPAIKINNWLVDREYLGPLRLLNFFCFAFLICKARNQIEKYVAWKGFALLSKYSLQVFAFHLFPIYLAALLLEGKKPLSGVMQIIVIGFCIASLFQIAFFRQMFNGLSRLLGNERQEYKRTDQG